VFARARLSAVLAACVLSASAACSSEDDRPDSGVFADAAVEVDAGQPDSGAFTVMCGSATCSETEFCYVTPNGACVANGGGACAATEEACHQEQISDGCTPARTRVCRALPAPCSTMPSCACLVAANPCAPSLTSDCTKPQRTGATIECPYP
jgi:hypothetical protein